MIIRTWKRLGLSGQILLGLAVGILTGLFFGESAAELSPLSDIYIKLMKMTVLPYLITSLVIAFGQLEMAQAKRLALRGGLLLLLIWAVMIAVLYAMPLAFPKLVSASFYSDALIEPTKPFSLAEIYFTSNPFESLSQNAVPAVVLFSSLMGVALIGLDNKARLLDPLRVWNKAMVSITHYVIALTPIGVFAIGAVTAGTMTGETFARLEAYFVAFAAASVLLGFVVLPLLVSAVTPFKYGEVTSIARDALLTAFVANNAFIVLPILVERSKSLLESHGLLDDRTDSAADVMIPVLYNFPNAGKLLTLLFIPFAAWLSGTPLTGDDYPTLFSVGIPSYFAKAQIALPFLLDLFGLPQDLFQLYIPTTILTGKFDAMVVAMNLLVFALLGAGAMGGFLVLEPKRLLRAAAIIAVSLVGTVLVVRLILGATIDTTYRMHDVVRQMHSPQVHTEVIVHRNTPVRVSAPDEGLTRLERIRRRGTLRIGYDEHNLPFSFFNSDGQLVGFDVEMATRLASSLRVTAEFVPLSWPQVPEMLRDGTIDVMPGIWYRPNWLGLVRLTDPYMVGTVALAVRDDRRQEFARIENLRHSHGLKVAVPLDRRQVEYSIERYFGNADVELVTVEHWKPFFEGKRPDIDAFLMPAEQASAWSLLYPKFAVVVPKPDPVQIATGFGVALDAVDLQQTINEWTLFAESIGEIKRVYNYWVQGQGALSSEPRWSIMHDVLGWDW